jgi:hypothetical protein
LNPELDLTPAQRKKALAGRVLEVSAGVKIGKGEQVVREVERNKAAKRVREGLHVKKQEREKNELEEVCGYTFMCPVFLVVLTGIKSGKEPRQLPSNAEKTIRTILRNRLD